MADHFGARAKVNLSNLIPQLSNRGSIMLATKSLPQEIIDPIDQALTYHGGDTRATIATLLADCGYLRDQLILARRCISRGLTRGWVPEVDRQD